MQDMGYNQTITATLPAGLSHVGAAVTPTPVAVQADGTIVLAAQSYVGSSYGIALARYHPDGSLDTSFGTGGKRTTAIGVSYGGSYSVAVQTDGMARLAKTVEFESVVQVPDSVRLWNTRPSMS